MISRVRLKIDAWFFISLAFFLLFSALSVWQIGRIGEKQAVVDSIAVANQQQEIKLRQLPVSDLERYYFYQVSVKGEFDRKSCFFVENVVRYGKQGYYVYCLFLPEDQERELLVNMGWLRQQGDRRFVPMYDFDWEGRQMIEGIIQKPRSTPVITPADGIPNPEHKALWSYFDFDKVKADRLRELYPIELQLISDADQQLNRDWPTFEAKIGMHIGYAIHWAAFALVTAFLYLRYLLKKPDNQDE